MGIGEVKKKAVFLDRDGVINALVPNPSTGDWEAPLAANQVRLLNGVSQAIRALTDAGYLLFVVSNQPNYAKNKASLEEIQKIHEKIEQKLAKAGARINAFFYCYHHPSGTKPGYSAQCDCRKPSPFFLLQAAKKHNLDLASSWMIGDRNSDIECGLAAGVRTILLRSLQDGGKRGPAIPGAYANNLPEAVSLIINTTYETGEHK